MVAVLDRLAPRLGLEPQLFGAAGYFEPGTMQIVVRSGQHRALQLSIHLHEIRHLEQYERDLCPSVSLSMQDHARVAFAMEADASTMSLFLAWRALMAGDPSVWEALLNRPSHTDIACRRARAFLETGDEALMAAEAFAQWYAVPDRRECYHVESCMACLERAESDRRVEGREALDPGFLSETCRLPGGEPYPCAEPSPLPRRAPRPGGFPSRAHPTRFRATRQRRARWPRSGIPRTQS